jgi:hypothetical protein
MTEPTNLNTKAKQLIDFHSITMVVVEHEGIDYIAVRPIVELLGTNWDSARKALFTGDNPDLYGLKELNRPVLDGFGGDIAAKKALYIRLDRSTMYLSRVDTSKMRAHGNVKAADNLLQLQIEWAEALHSYESSGISVKARHARFASLTIKDFLAVAKEKRVTDDGGDRQVLHSVMKELAEKIGHPYQADMLDDQQSA